MLVVGDSVAAGVGLERVEQTFAALLARRLASHGQRVELDLRTGPGERVREIAPPAGRYTLALVFVGANDGLGFTPRSRFRRDVRAMAARLASTPDRATLPVRKTSARSARPQRFCGPSSHDSTSMPA